MIDPHEPGAPQDPASLPSDGGDADDRPGAEDSAAAAPEFLGWTPFDPGDPPPLPTSFDGSGRVVAIVGSPELVGVGWAVSVASELARVWARQRPGLVLVDTDLARPRLHHGVQVDNTVGLAEVLRGEAPVASATRTVDEDTLFCVPAGNAPEPEPLFDPSRWGKLCAAFSAAGVTVVAYVPAGAPWIDDVLATSTDVVELRERHRQLHWPRDQAPPVLAVLGPMTVMRPPEDPTGRERSSAIPLLGFHAAEGEDVPVQGPTSTDTSEEPNAGSDPPRDAAGEGRTVGIRRDRRSGRGTGTGRTSRPHRRTGRRGWQAATVLVGLLAVGAWAWTLVGGGPDVQGEADAPAVQTNGVDLEEGMPPPRPVPPSAHYSVAVGAYTDGVGARARAEELAGLFPAVPWLVAPVEVDGTVYHRVLGGLVADSVTAATLGGTLARDPRAGITEWVVRGSEWVVDLGERATLAEAERRRARSREAGLPADVAQIRYTDQSVRYRIYAGGFGDAAEAGYLLAVAQSAGFEDAVVTRRWGRPVS